MSATIFKEGELMKTLGGRVFPYIIRQINAKIIVQRLTQVKLLDPQEVVTWKYDRLIPIRHGEFGVRLVEYRKKLWLVTYGNKDRPPMGLPLSQWIDLEKQKYIQIVGLEARYRQSL